MISHSKSYFDNKEKIAVENVLLTGMASRGKKTKELEYLITSSNLYAGSIAVSSASYGIYLILKCRFPQGGAKVGLSSYVCRSVYDAINMADCTSILFDIDSSTFGLNPKEISKGSVDIVIVTHMFGVQSDVIGFSKKGIEVIEDCAQRISLNTNEHDSIAEWKVYSFEGTKLLSCGQGGIISAKAKNDIEDIKELSSGEYKNQVSIGNPFTDIQAAIAIEQWKKLNHFLKLRKKIAEYYIFELEKLGLINIIDPSMLKDDTWHFRFIVNIRNPEYYILKMEDEGIICRKPVNPFGLHKLFNIPGNFANTDLATNSLLSIPIYPTLYHMGQEKVIHSLIKVHEQNKNK